MDNNQETNIKRRRSPSFYNKLLFLTIFPLMFFALIIRYGFMPDALGDSNYLLKMVNDPYYKFSLHGNGFNHVAVIYRAINFLGISSLVGWSAYLGIIFNTIIIGYISKNRIKTFFELILAYAFLGLLDIFVFTLLKECVQFSIFMLIYFIAKSKCQYISKIILICGVFLVEVFLFRGYYILEIVFLVALSIVIPKILKSKREAKDIVVFFIVGFLGLYLFLVICERVVPSEYQSLVGIRALSVDVYERMDANTLIKDLIPSSGNSKAVYIFNFLINFARVFFPVELIGKGLYYWPFCIFQFLCTYKLIGNLVNYRRLTEREQLYFNIMLAYYMMSVFFEVDFGTFIRHEAATAPILFNLMLTDFKVPVHPFRAMPVRVVVTGRGKE